MSSISDLQTAALDGDPAARFIDELGARFDAVQRGACPDCGAEWMPENLGGLWGAVVEHEDGCPSAAVR